MSVLLTRSNTEFGDLSGLLWVLFFRLVPRLKGKNGVSIITHPVASSRASFGGSFQLVVEPF